MQTQLPSQLNRPIEAASQVSDVECSMNMLHDDTLSQGHPWTWKLTLLRINFTLKTSRSPIYRVCFLWSAAFGIEKRSQRPSILVLGLPWGLVVISRPSDFVAVVAQASVPNGVPRLTLRRMAVNSASVCGEFTCSNQPGLRRIGHADNNSFSAAVPECQR